VIPRHFGRNRPGLISVSLDVTRSRSAAAAVAACALVAVLAGCAGEDNVRSGDSPKAAGSEAPEGTPSDEPIDPVPTLRPPKRPPSGPTDVVKGKRVTLTGTVVQKPGGCTMLETADRGTVVLVDGRMGTFGLGNGHHVEVVAVARPGLRSGCGGEMPTFSVEQARPI
jgi:hypothetical protein